MKPTRIAAALLLAMAAVYQPAHAKNGDTPRYGKFEASFQLPDIAGNPFDPDVNDVDAAIMGPSGKSVTIPAFWDGSVWRIRYAPHDTGKYTIAITRNGVVEQPKGLAATTFQCVASSSLGYVRVDKAHQQRFSFDNGSTYYPIGCDQAWGTQKPGDYDDAFFHMKDAGMNWARVWMNHWDNKNLEWSNPSSNSPKLGVYSMAAAKRWDDIVDAAQANNVYLQVTLQHHGQWTTKVDPNWGDNPYNAAMPGGFLKNPEDFFTDPRAIKLTKAKYRYIVARWGYSDHIMGWELFNEIQNNPEEQTHFDRVIAWHQAMAAYLRNIDPNHHLITSSYTDPGNDLERGVAFDYDQKHNYISDVIGLFSSANAAPGDRPWFYGEWGHGGSDLPSEASNIAFLHDGLWSGVMTNLAGAQQYWYWDRLTSNAWWSQFRSVTDYLKTSKITAQKDLQRIDATSSSKSLGNMTFAPLQGWGADTKYDATISADGAIAGTDGMSQFVQGAGHRDMRQRPVSLHVDFRQTGQFILKIATVAASGAHPQLLLDGQVKTEKDFGPAAKDRHEDSGVLAIDVPAGKHVIGVYNSDHDWYTVENFTLVNYVPSIGVLAKGTEGSIYFWAYNRTRLYQSDTAQKPVEGIVSLPVKSGAKYRVTLWDTRTGKPLSAPTTIRATDGNLSVPITLGGQDVAGWAVKVK